MNISEQNSNLINRLQDKNLISQNILNNELFKLVLNEVKLYEAELIAQNEELIEKEKTLKEKNSELSVLFEEAPIAYFVLDDKLRLINFNKKSKEFFTLKKHTQNDKHIISLLHNEDHEKFFLWFKDKDKFVKEAINLKFKTKESIINFQVQGSIQKIDSYTKHYFLSLSVIKEKQNNTYNPQFEQTKKLAKMGIWQLNSKENKLLTCEKFNSIYGFTNKSNPSINDILKVIHKEDKRKVLNSISNLSTKIFNGELKYRIVLKDNTIKDILSTWEIAYDDARKAIGINGYSQDITEFTRNSKQLEMFKKIVEEVNVGVILADAKKDNMPMFYANNAFERITGYKKVDVNNRNCRYLQGKNTDQNAINTIRTAIKSKKPCNVTLINYKKSGEAFWNQLNLTPIFDSNNNLDYYVGIQDDITDKIKAKEKEQEQQAFLIQQSRLAQLGEMLSMISHQWRQPLATINSVVSKVNVKMELKVLKKSDISSSNEKILAVTNHLTNTINDFKNFYKKDKQKKTFDLKDCLNSALKIIEGNFEKNKVLLKTDLEDNLKIHSHRGELQQVILVIVNNAIDAMENLNENRDKHICISSKKENGKIKISIKDTANGIPQIIQDRIFDPYFSTKLEKNGSGLGLYMAKMIVDKTLKGKLNFSTSEKGTIFTLVL